MLAHAAVQLGVEILRCRLGEQRLELGVRGDARQGFALEPVAGLEESRRDRARLPYTAGRQPGLCLLRQVEPVGGEPHRILPLG